MASSSERHESYILRTGSLNSKVPARATLSSNIDLGSSTGKGTLVVVLYAKQQKS